MKITIDEQKICSLVRDYIESMSDLMQEQKIVQVNLNNDGEETFAEIHMGEIDSSTGPVPMWEDGTKLKDSPKKEPNYREMLKGICDLWVNQREEDFDDFKTLMNFARESFEEGKT